MNQEVWVLQLCSLSFPSPKIILAFQGHRVVYVELWSLFYPKKAVGSLDTVQGRIIKMITGCNRLFSSVWAVWWMLSSGKRSAQRQLWSSCKVMNKHKKWKQWLTLFFWAPKSLQMVIAAMKLKDAYSLEGKLWPT